MDQGLPQGAILRPMWLKPMDAVAQQNPALVEQAAAAVGSMRDLSANLVDVVSVFQVREGQLYQQTSAGLGM